jgi:hypothetical protein
MIYSEGPMVWGVIRSLVVRIDDSIFTQFPEHDLLITEWFDKNSWPISVRHFDFDREVLAWRHETPALARTIQITKSTLEDYPAASILSLFEATRIAEVMVANPTKYIVLSARSGSGICFDILDKPAP